MFVSDKKKFEIVFYSFKDLRANLSLQLSAFSFRESLGVSAIIHEQKFLSAGRKYFWSALKCQVCFTNTHQIRNNTKIYCAIKRNSVAGHLTQSPVFWVVSKLNCHLTQVRGSHAPRAVHPLLLLTFTTLLRDFKHGYLRK